MISNRLWPQRHFFLFFSLVTVAAHSEAGAGRGMFSPRMDYDEWTPLGRGDPLKNDPTYDYQPPVLDRVNYWLAPEARTPDPPLSTTPESQTKPPPQADSRRDTFDPLMHFISERKHSVSRLRPQYIPLQVQGGYLAYRPAPVRPPYTMLVPPPPGPGPDQYPAATSSTTTTSTTESTTASEVAGAAGGLNSTAVPEEVVSTVATTFATPEATASTLSHIHKVLSPMIDIHPSGQQSLSSSILQILLQDEMSTSLRLPSTNPSTTPHPSLTTDPLFSHYKQPTEPLRGPMYLIIQGHSKVKTYGASKLDKLSGLPIQDGNEVEEGRRRRRQVDYEDFLPIEETVEAVINDYIDNGADTEEGSSLVQLLSAVSS